MGIADHFSKIMMVALVLTGGLALFVPERLAHATFLGAANGKIAFIRSLGKTAKLYTGIICLTHGGVRRVVFLGRHRATSEQGKLPLGQGEYAI